jgi:hypothetical protein
MNLPVGNCITIAAIAPAREAASALHSHLLAFLCSGDVVVESDVH